MAIDVTDAGSLLSCRSYAVCIVNFVRNINCLCHLNPAQTNKELFFIFEKPIKQGTDLLSGRGAISSPVDGQQKEQ